jgi:regulatory protein
VDDEISPLVVEIKAVCLRLLARREHSRQELLNKLQMKGYGKEDCSPVIEALTNQDWQNDQRYAESYVRSCLQRGYGPIFVKHNLRQQGINDVDIDGIAQATVGSWTLQLGQVYAKKYGQTPVLSQKEWAKRSRFLLQRGFSQAMISALFDDLNITMDNFRS